MTCMETDVHVWAGGQVRERAGRPPWLLVSRRCSFGLHRYNRVSNGSDGTAADHARSRPAHDLANPFAHGRSITVRGASRAKCLGAHVGTVLDARGGVGLQLGALGAERNGSEPELDASGLFTVGSLLTLVASAMMPTAPQCNHLRHHLGLAFTFARQLRRVDRARH